MLYVLYKTTNLVNRREYWGIKETQDIFFGTDMSSDSYCGEGLDLLADLRAMGRHAFICEAVHAYTEEELAKKALKKILDNLPANSYNRVRGCPIGSTKPDEWIAAKSAAWSGENNPMHGKKHSDDAKKKMAGLKAAARKINNGFEERIILKGEPIPEGWVLGRRPTAAVRAASRTLKSD